MAVIKQAIVTLIFQARGQDNVREFVAVVSGGIKAGATVAQTQQASEFFPGQEVTPSRLRTWR